MPADASPYAGMTVNERLVLSGRIADWDAAVTARDRAAMVAVLERVDLGGQAGAIADRVLADPGKYGF